MSDVAAGTALCVAPERLVGAAATVQSDVFALGILLYQLVIGDLRRPLVSGWEREVPHGLLREDIAAATDGNPAHRLSSAAALAERLRRRELRAAESARAKAVGQAAYEAAEALKRGRAAIADLTESRDQLIKLFGLDNPQVEFFNYYLALSLSDRGRQSEASAIASKLSAAALADAGEGGEDWAQRLDALRGEILVRQGRKSEAVGLLAPAVAKMQCDHLPEGMLDPFRAAG